MEYASANKDDLSEKWKHVTCTTLNCEFLHENDFQTYILLAGMVSLISKTDDIYNDWTSRKLAQR